jgi:hypothetical protein
MRRTMAIMVLLAVALLCLSTFLLSCVVSCVLLSRILLPHVAYRLRALIGRIRTLGQGS